MQAQFFTPLDSRHIEGPYRMLLCPFSGYSARYDLTWVVPARFVGDEASVPRLPLAYALYGGRGSRGAWPHDFGYRWGFENVTRLQWDMIFMEANKVYHDSMTKQGIFRRIMRKNERFWMTSAVVVFGGFAYKNYPGCLDYREARRYKCPADNKMRCIDCELFYPRWRDCVRPGFHPELWRKHDRD